MSLFNRITIKTPESVEIEYTLAGIGSRALALIIDYTIWWLLLTLLSLLATVIAAFIVNAIANIAGTASNMELWLSAFFLLVFFGVYIGYFVFFETIWQGQTPGKRYAKIRVICDDGKPVGLVQATLRSLLRPVDEFLFIGAFAILFTKQEKRLGDWLAGTVVIQEAAQKDARIKVSDRAKKITQDLQQQTDLSQLLPDDFAAVRSYLQRRSTLTQQARRKVARSLTEPILETLGLDDIPQGETAEIFLEALYLAYQQRSLKP
jgi:uncharacterized RDD family membrane protein YckC